MSETNIITRKRNTFGLIEGVEYPFKSDGRVDWRKMIEPQYIVINTERTLEQDITKVPEEALLVLLQGYRNLATLRGFSSVKHSLLPSSHAEFVAVETCITWIPNYETDGLAVSFSACADAHLNNTKSLGQNFLTSIAENRGFVRAVRGFLNIPVLGKDELPSCNTRSMADSSGNEAHKVLEDFLAANKIKFNAFLNRMIKDGVEGADSWTKMEDIPQDQVIPLIERVKAVLQAKIRAAEQKKLEQNTD
jgi:hypothetical protein